MRLPDLGVHLREQGVTPQQKLTLFPFCPTVMTDRGREREVIGPIDLDERFLLTVVTAQSVQAVLRIKKRAGGWDEATTVVVGRIAQESFVAPNGDIVVPVHGLITTMEGAMRQRD